MAVDAAAAAAWTTVAFVAGVVLPTVAVVVDGVVLPAVAAAVSVERFAVDSVPWILHSTETMIIAAAKKLAASVAEHDRKEKLPPTFQAAFASTTVVGRVYSAPMLIVHFVLTRITGDSLLRATTALVWFDPEKR